MSQAHPSMPEGRKDAPLTEVVTQLCCGQPKVKKGGIGRERHALQMMPQQTPPVLRQQLLRKGLRTPPQRPNVMKREPHAHSEQGRGAPTQHGRARAAAEKSIPCSKGARGETSLEGSPQYGQGERTFVGGATHSLRHPRTEIEEAELEKNAAEPTTTHLAQEIGPKQGRHHYKPGCYREATPKLSMGACISKPFKTSMI